MSKLESNKDLVIELLNSKASVKRELCKLTEEVFDRFKQILQELVTEYSAELRKKKLRFNFKERNDFEAEIDFAGDILYFTMHSNIFNFEPTHGIHKTQYVREDDTRAYCGMIQIHNFLFDSIKYRRHHDIGYLIGRIFINREKHFFVEGKRQLGFLYNDFENAVINDVYIRAIIESAILYTIDFDLLVPPFEEVKEITVHQKLNQRANAAFRTGKRLGFKFQYEDDEKGSAT